MERDALTCSSKHDPAGFDITGKRITLKQNTHTLSILNLLQSEYTRDPYSLYHRLREHDPLFWDERFQSWVLTRHADIVAVLRDPRFTAERAFRVPEEAIASVRQPVLALSCQMLFLDQPDHTRLRSLVAGSFTPRAVESMRAPVQQKVDSLLDMLLPRGQVEAITDFASPLASGVMATLLGLPQEDRTHFARWANDYGALIDGTKATIEDVIQLLQKLSEALDYFREMIKKRKNAPQNDLLQRMISAHEQGDCLNEAELLGNLVLLLAAGIITTTHLIGNGLLALARHPEQYEVLQKKPDLVSSAVIEFLRYDSPTQSTERLPRADLEIGGKQLKRGQPVLLCLGAANHDPAQFSNPDKLDFARTDNRHVAFSHGAHFCLGAPLARLEAEVAFRTLLTRLKRFPMLVNEPEHAPSIAFRILKSLPLTFP